MLFFIALNLLWDSVSCDFPMLGPETILIAIIVKGEFLLTGLALTQVES